MTNAALQDLIVTALQCRGPRTDGQVAGDMVRAMQRAGFTLARPAINETLHRHVIAMPTRIIVTVGGNGDAKMHDFASRRVLIDALGPDVVAQIDAGQVALCRPYQRGPEVDAFDVLLAATHARADLFARTQFIDCI